MIHADKRRGTGPKVIVLWVIWASIFSALFFYRSFLEGSFEGSGMLAENPSLLWGLYGGTLVIAFSLRFFLLTRARKLQQALTLMIIGLAVSESLTFYGLFLFPEYLDLMFYTSVVLVFVYIPTYASRLK